MNYSTKWCEHCQCRHPSNWVRDCHAPSALAAIPKESNAKPEIKERDEVIERLKTRLSKTNDSFRGQVTNDGTDWLQHCIDNEEAILAAEQLLKGKQ